MKTLLSVLMFLSVCFMCFPDDMYTTYEIKNGHYYRTFHNGNASSTSGPNGYYSRSYTDGNTTKTYIYNDGEDDMFDPDNNEDED